MHFTNIFEKHFTGDLFIMAKAKTVTKIGSVKNTTRKKVKTVSSLPLSASMSKGGRPVGTGKYGCQTKTVRIPVHLVEEVQRYVKRKINAQLKEVK